MVAVFMRHDNTLNSSTDTSGAPAWKGYLQAEAAIHQHPCPASGNQQRIAFAAAAKDAIS